MNDNTTIELDTNWRYFFAESKRSDYSKVNLDDSDWIPLPSLSDWSVASSAQSGADWFRRDLELNPPVHCVSYILKIDKVPEEITVYVNGKRVGQADVGRGFSVDVTECVHSGNNLLAIQLICVSDTGGGKFGSIQLQEMTCEE